MGGGTLGEGRIGATEGDENSRVSQNNAKHRRSKSATDGNVNISGAGVSRAIQNGRSHVSLVLERTCGDQSPLPKCSTNPGTDAALHHRASLEKDIEHLQVRLEQEKSMRMVLEKAMGRASSTLSPGHRHFSTQAKELITEIELLEEEVANREQHVLSLYRSIFEQCVSRTSSEQSSGRASPAHTKNEHKKHPSIISSTFCSAKNFPLRPFQALASISDSGKISFPLQSKTRHASLLGGKANETLEKTRSSHGKVHEEKTPVLRTLKDHLYQCPSKLSEEMVRCMAAVYCWLCGSAVSSNLEQNRSSLLSRSSTKAVLPRCGTSDEGDWSCKSMVEILSLSTDKNNFSRASYAINNYRHLVEQLERVNVTHMETNAKIAFWINTYNALVMHAYLAYGIPHRPLKKLALYQKASYNISGHIVSANVIEQSIFCLLTPRVGRWFEIIFSTALRKRSGERQIVSSKFCLAKSEPLVCFALCTGAFSDPALRVYTASNVIEELEVAKKEFLQSNVVVKKSSKVFLPKVVERFSKEAATDMGNLLNFISESVDKKLSDSIRKCTESKTGKKVCKVIEWLPYDPRFRYLLSQDLLEKPWWV